MVRLPSRRRRRNLPFRLALASLASALVGAGIAMSAPAGAANAPATFSKPLILVGGGAEPSIRVPGDGKSAAYVSAPASLGSNFWRVTEQKNANGSISFIQSPVQQPDLGTGGGDSEISVGNTPNPSTGCNTIAYSGLHNIDLLDNFTVAKSTDCGKTFTLANPYATQNTLTDRQWQAFDGAKTNFLIYHKVDTSQIVVSESIDGGHTYVSLSQGVNGVIDAQTFPKVDQWSQIGNIVTDYSRPTGANNPLSGEPEHDLYATFAGPRSVADDLQAQIEGNTTSESYNHTDTVYLARSTNGGLTWTDHVIYSVSPTTKRELNMLFPVISVDHVGNLYAVWSDTFKIQYAVSTDHGLTWSKPYQVNADNRGTKPEVGKADVFPWIEAGANGFLDVVWYHGEGGAPGSNLVHRDPGDQNTHWTVAFAQLAHAATKDASGAAKPTVVNYSKAITPVVHTGDICQNGTFCSLVPVSGAPFSTGDRSLLDFFEVAIDAAGRANIALADNAEAPGQYITAYIRQTGGYSARTGKRLTQQTVTQPLLQCSADASFTDPSGDATELIEPTPLPNAPALDVTKGFLSYAGGALTLHIHVTNLSKDPPTGATGEQFEFAFSHAAKTYVAVATHDATSATNNFHMESPLRTTVGPPLTGAFDKAHSEVRIVVPSTFFGALSPTVPGFSAGEKVTGLAVTSRRDIANAIVPNADEAGGLCPFAVPSTAVSQAAVAATVLAPTDNRAVPAEISGSLRKVGLPAGLPIAASVILLLAAVVTRSRGVVSRR
jgi:hypothetical protein